MSGKKHIFLLDDNIVEYGVKGTNKQDEQDLTCTTLIVNIGRKCHKIHVWPTINRKIHRYLDQGKKYPMYEGLGSFLKNLIVNSDKWHEYIYSDPGLTLIPYSYMKCVLHNKNKSLLLDAIMLR